MVSVEANGPAQRAGLRERDLIAGVNGSGVSTVDDIHRILAGQAAGSRLTLTILRDGERQELEVISGEA